MRPVLAIVVLLASTALLPQAAAVCSFGVLEVCVGYFGEWRDAYSTHQNGGVHVRTMGTTVEAGQFKDASYSGWDRGFHARVDSGDTSAGVAWHSTRYPECKVSVWGGGVSVEQPTPTDLCVRPWYWDELP